MKYLLQKIYLTLFTRSTYVRPVMCQFPWTPADSWRTDTQNPLEAFIHDATAFNPKVAWENMCKVLSSRWHQLDEIMQSYQEEGEEEMQPGFFCETLDDTLNSIDIMYQMYRSHGYIKDYTDLWLVCSPARFSELFMQVQLAYGVSDNIARPKPISGTKNGEINGVSVWVSKGVPESAMFVLPEFGMPEFVGMKDWNEYKETVKDESLPGVQ